MDLAPNGDGMDSPKVELSGAAVLLVIGEPFSDVHRNLILSEITKGIRIVQKIKSSFNQFPKS